MTTAISDRQLEIIEAAGKILTTSGVSGLTIKNLAKEMKFSESAIYRHFTSKEEIIIALLEYLQFPAINHPKKNSQRCFKISFHFLKRTHTL